MTRQQQRENQYPEGRYHPAFDVEYRRLKTLTFVVENRVLVEVSAQVARFGAYRGLPLQIIYRAGATNPFSGSAEMQFAPATNRSINR